MYHLSVLPPKQHKIPLIVSRQISIPNVSPNLTDAQVGTRRAYLTKLLEVFSTVSGVARGATGAMTPPKVLVNVFSAMN